jgi:phthiodiolone/phenolphthiodiolone dimycocerosates ketoreductase
VNLLERDYKDSASHMIRFGVQLRPSPLAEIARQSRLCEKLEFDSIWCPDHLIGGPPTTIWPELYTSLAVMCSSTSHVTIGSAATDCLHRHPARIAQAVASLSQSGTRNVVLGLGAGEAVNLEPFGTNAEDLHIRLREAIIVMRKLLSSNRAKPANFDGKYFRLRNAFLQTGPEIASIPVYIAAFQPRMLALTGELGDGWMPFSVPPRTYRILLNRIGEELEKNHRSLANFEATVVPITMVSKTAEYAERQVLDPARRYLALLPSVLRTVLPDFVHPGKEYSLSYWQGALNERQREVLKEAAGRIPQDLALETAVCGTPGKCIEQVSEFAKAGCKHFIFGVRDEDSIHLLARSVVPYFRRR